MLTEDAIDAKTLDAARFSRLTGLLWPLLVCLAVLLPGSLSSAMDQSLGAESSYQEEMLRRDLELKRLELQVAREREARARQATINVALLSLLLLALVLWLAYSLGQQRRRAQTDYLTGIANRGRAFEQGFPLCERARRNGRDLSVVLFDLDRFKKVNDTLGHAAGDRALIEVVEVVRGVLPKKALFARIGGEEFIAILPGRDREQAQDIAEDLRAAVAASGFLHAGKHPVNVTISLGVATLDESADFQTLVNRADEALYVAKHSGRNRVVLASSTAERLSEGKVAVGSRHAPRD